MIEIKITPTQSQILSMWYADGSESIIDAKMLGVDWTRNKLMIPEDQNAIDVFGAGLGNRADIARDKVFHGESFDRYDREEAKKVLDLERRVNDVGIDTS